MTTMKNSIHDNANGLDYTLVNDYYLPNLTAAAPAEHPTGRWGRLHKMYLKEQHPIRYNQLLPSGIINCSCPVSWAAILPSWTSRPRNSLH